MELPSSKIKKIPILREMKLSSPKIKKVFILSQKKNFLYFRKRNLFKNLFKYQEVTFQVRKINHSYLGKWNFVALKNLIKLFYINKTFLYSQ